MKAVIVIHMPTKCSNCSFVEEWINDYGEKFYYCPYPCNEYTQAVNQGQMLALDEITGEIE